MKNFILSTITILLPLCLNAQQGVVTTGGEIHGETGSISFSTGQTDFINITSDEASVQFGLQQHLSVIKETHTLTLLTSPENTGQTTGQGDYVEGEEINISVEYGNLFFFYNWTDHDDNIVSEQESFTYTMPAHDVTLTANFLLMGDVNNDGVVNIQDVVMLIDYILEREPEGFWEQLADVNGDGVIDISDLVAIIDIILGGKIDYNMLATSETAYMIMEDGLISLYSDGTVTALQFEILLDNMHDVEMELLKESHDIAYAIEGNTIKGVIFSFNNTPLPKGNISLLQTNINPENMQWGNLGGANTSAQSVDVQPKTITTTADLNQKNIQIFPNPARDELNIHADGLMQRITITDIAGNKMHESEPKTGETKISLAGFDSGVYIVRIFIDENLFMEKIIVN